MTTGIVIAAIIIVLALVVAVGLGFVQPPGIGKGSGTGPGGLRRRFGPEYERVVARHGGDKAAARKELQERLKRHGKIEFRPLTWQDRERYAAEWTGIQERFVDSPASAVGEAETLLDRLVQERGYPDAQSGEQIDALSVHRPQHVQSYREIREAAAAGGQATDGEDSTASTEELRLALVRARGLFDDLVKPGPQDQQAAKNGAAPGKPGIPGKLRTGRIHLPSRSTR
ncbi:hypothetical protein OG607_32515 [Streptomyces sp. NBC_01537]|uniref:hypothetical protein n=1 Tax=Streptomyces sp. NBC_01537 TaxID=2903896 RepID=UPI00386821DF